MKFGISEICFVFLNTKYLMLPKAAFIWSKIQYKQKYCEILLQFKISFNIFWNIIYSCDATTPVFSIYLKKKKSVTLHCKSLYSKDILNW